MNSHQILAIIADYERHAHDIRRIRDQVFLMEQQISREEEYDGRDTVCVHGLVFCDGQAVGTGRLDVEKSGKVGRLAVLKEYRRRGLGSTLMKTLEEEALARNLSRVWFHAQVSAIPFYEKLAYQIVSEEFEEAGISHVVMQKILGLESNSRDG